MKHFKRFCLLLAVTALGCGNIHAQYVTTHAKATLPGQQNGIYYSLPRTVLQLDFIIEETQLFEGPYSEFANMVGANDYVIEDGMEYKIKEVVLHPVAEADPNATFFVAMSSKKDAKTNFCMTPQGILQGVGIECPIPTCKEVAPILPKEASNDINFKYQYSTMGGRSVDQLARSAADMINKIRDEKLKLITGFQETAFTPDTYRQMYADLDAMENDYLSLFVGKRITKTVTKTVYVIPNKDVPTLSVAKFSSEEGFSIGTNGPGSVITVQTVSLQTIATINAPSQSAVESLKLENKLFYRIPEIATVKVNMGSQLLLEQRETIAQYGVFMLAPLGKTNITLDSHTGQVINLGLE